MTVSEFPTTHQIGSSYLLRSPWAGRVGIETIRIKERCGRYWQKNGPAPEFTSSAIWALLGELLSQWSSLVRLHLFLGLKTVSVLGVSEFIAGILLGTRWSSLMRGGAVSVNAAWWRSQFQLARQSFQICFLICGSQWSLQDPGDIK